MNKVGPIKGKKETKSVVRCGEPEVKMVTLQSYFVIFTLLTFIKILMFLWTEKRNRSRTYTFSQIIIY